VITARTATGAPARAAARLAAVSVALSLLAACGSSTTGSPTAQAPGTTTFSPSSAAATTAGKLPFPTLTAPNLQPPVQQNEGRPDVAFDPCTWVDDATLSQLGYNPQSRKRGIDIHAEYTFLVCWFESPDKVYGLQVLSGNRTMDEGRAKFTSDGAKIEDTTIDGRAAMIVRPKSGDTCIVLLQTKVGYADFARDIRGYLVKGPLPERCSGMVELVQGTIPRIGDN
jgi:hypothetical protein